MQQPELQHLGYLLLHKESQLVRRIGVENFVVKIYQVIGSFLNELHEMCFKI